LIRFLVVGDVHYSDSTPRGRRDDFPRSCLRKLSEVGEIAREEGVRAVLQLGDLFDRPTLPLQAAADLAEVLRGYPCPIYAIPGNHDLPGGPQSLARTMLGFFHRLGLIRLVHEEPVILKEGIQISGTTYHPDMDRRDRQEDYAPPPAPPGVHTIHLVHGMLLEEPLFPDQPWTQVDEIWPFAADLTLSGHYHYGFRRVIEREGKAVANPGALCRLSATPEEMARRPKVLLVLYQPERLPPFSFRELPLSSASPGEEVLSREHLEARRRQAVGEFAELIEETSVFQAFEMREIVERLSDRDRLPREVREKALEFLARARELVEERVE